MPRFLLNNSTQYNGDHEIHDCSSGCEFMPRPENQVDLGSFQSCAEALITAQKKWPHDQINGCYYCCQNCNSLFLNTNKY